MKRLFISYCSVDELEKAKNGISPICVYLYSFFFFYKYQLHECEKYNKLIKKIEKNTDIKKKKEKKMKKAY